MPTARLAGQCAAKADRSRGHRWSSAGCPQPPPSLTESFAAYSFSKAHSASFAVESFQSLYLKAHFPLEFIVAVINNFGGFYDTEIYLHEARRWGAIVHAPCVNHSEYLSCLRGKDIYLGFIHLKDLEEKAARQCCPDNNIIFRVIFHPQLIR